MINIKNISKSFNGKKALNDVSFDIKKGIITGLVGSNGSGKSTIMRLISTLLKQERGKILVDGIDTVKSPEKAREKIGVLLGGDISLYDRLTAKENIIYFAELQGIDKKMAEKRIGELSSLLGMDEYINRKVAGFSRGMRQKVAFSRAIIHSPEIILLDEPSTGLDIDSIRDVQSFIIYCKEQGKTVLLSTHNAHEMEKLCDEIVFIEQGKIIIQGKKNILLKESKCEDVSELYFYYKSKVKRE